MKISVIIPTFNEEQNIAVLICFLKEHGTASLKEIIVADGGSDDNTIETATAAGAQVVKSPEKGRAAQMNYGASFATGDVLYFVHADTFPSSGFARDIGKAIKTGFDLGRYRTRFLSRSWLLRINAWFTRFDWFIGMGGDQTLFIRKTLFDKLGGFDDKLMIMEDYEFCQRARQWGNYRIMNGEALVSARKYDKNSWLTVQLANYKVVSLYKQGAGQQQMVDEYRRRLKW